MNQKCNKKSETKITQLKQHFALKESRNPTQKLNKTKNYVQTWKNCNKFKNENSSMSKCGQRF